MMTMIPRNDRPNGHVQVLRRLSNAEFQALGLETVAYVRTIEQDGEAAVAIHAADGRQLAVVADIGTALSTIWYNDLEPASLH